MTGPDGNCTDISLLPDLLPTFQHLAEKNVEAFLDGQEHKTGHHGAQIVHNVINA